MHPPIKSSLGHAGYGAQPRCSPRSPAPSSAAVRWAAPRLPRRPNGRLGADSTLLAPGTGAFSIWSLVYLGLVVYAIWQLTPRAARE